ncbi:MAG TPA: hypothetical protein VGO68_07320 [Pyrinomonadaceae bacterium]|nr:hypothetical protein [Pyrinomonadaceae bacterium]
MKTARLNVSGNTSMGNKALPDTHQTCRSAGMMASRPRQSAFCANNGSGGSACRRAIHSAAGLDVSRKAWLVIN